MNAGEYLKRALGIHNRMVALEERIERLRARAERMTSLCGTRGVRQSTLETNTRTEYGIGK